jgi:phage gp46-like protein
MSINIITENGRLLMSYSEGNELVTNVILSLEIVQGSFFLDPAFGLKKRERMKNTDATAQLIKGDIKAALQWLIDSGRASVITVQMEKDTLVDKSRLKASVTVIDAKGAAVTYDKFVEVV